MFKNRCFILSVSFVVALLLGILYAWSVFVVPLEQTFGWKRDQTSLTFTLLMSFFCLGMILGGRFIKKFGTSTTVLLGGALGGAGFFAASFTDSLTWLYVSYGIIGGFGIGLANVTITSVAIRQFPDHRGLAGGIVTAGLALGTFLLGSKCAPYFMKDIGWQGTFRYIGLAYWIFICSLSFFIRFPSVQKPEGAKEKDGRAGEVSSSIWGFSAAETFKTSTAWFVFLWVMLMHTGGLMIIAHISPYVQSKGFTPADGAFMVGVVALANASGRFTFGFLHDRLGRKAATLLNSLVIVVALVALALLPLEWGYNGLFIGAALSGFGYGGSIPQLAAMVGSFFGPRNFGLNYGCFSIASLLASVAGPYLGAHVEKAFNYQTSILIAAGVTGISLIAALLLCAPKNKGAAQVA